MRGGPREGKGWIPGQARDDSYLAPKIAVPTRTSVAPSAEIVADGPVLLLFYIFDWTST